MSNCKNCENCNCEPDPGRRKTLGVIIGVLNAAVAIPILGPVLGFISAPLARRQEPQWVSVLNDAELGEGSTQEVDFSLVVKDGFRTSNRRYSIYVHRSADGVKAFFPSCTHLGCRVEYQEDNERYFCPCHGGVFSADGAVVAGPPPRALDEFETKVEDGQIWIKKEV